MLSSNVNNGLHCAFEMYRTCLEIFEWTRKVSFEKSLSFQVADLAKS